MIKSLDTDGYKYIENTECGKTRQACLSSYHDLIIYKLSDIGKVTWVLCSSMCFFVKIEKSDEWYPPLEFVVRIKWVLMCKSLEQDPTSNVVD